MRRISAPLLLSAVVLAGSLATARGQGPAASRVAFGYGRKMPPAPPAPMPAPVVQDSSVELAALESRTISVPATGSAGSGTPSVQSVNCRSLVIDFELKGLGTSGIGSVELWYTRNGQIWRKYPGPAQSSSPFVVDVTEDGLYGFTVVAKNGMGIGKAPPRPGDPPHVWVDVDTTRPEVHLLSTQAGVDESGRTLTLRWTATDRNLVARPITLSYAENPQGPWMPFATNLDNSGFYSWRMSPGLPSQVLVRVEATDRVGNISGDQSAMPAPLDLTRPTAMIKNVSRNGIVIQQAGGH